MKRMRRNPLLFWPTIILSAMCIVMVLPIPSAGMDLQPWGSIVCVFIARLLLQNTGTDLSLKDDGIKLGFTKISWDSIDHFDFDSEARIVIVTRIGVRRSFTLTRRHYHPSDWESVRERLLKVSTTVA